MSIVIPVLVFLTSIFSGVAINNIELIVIRPYEAIVAVALFSAICSFFVSFALTQPLKEIVKKAEKLVRFESGGKSKGEMMEIYDVIESLLDLLKARKITDSQKQLKMIDDLEKLDYLLPLGYMSLMVAHEVRNPLSTIWGMSDLLKNRIKDPQLIEYIEASRKAAQRIDMFTKELLDFTDDEVYIERFDLNHVILEILGYLRMEFPKVRYDFEGPDSVIFYGDRTKIHQILYNIIKNAFEHEIDGGYVRVKTWQDKESVFASTYNMSSYIEQDDIEHIFKPFFTRKKGGKGLGLFIAIKNARLHGGDVKAESIYDGTTFTLSLPISRTQRTEEEKWLT